MNLAQILRDSVARDPDQIAVKLDDFALNYGLLEQATMRIAGLLRDRGVGAGDRVALMLPNVPHFVVAYYGILRAGAIVVPMNVLNKHREVEYYLRDSGAKLMFVWKDLAVEAEPAATATGLRVDLGCDWRVRADPVPDRARHRDSRARTLGHSRAALHVRDHGDAEGRRTHAQQHAAQLRGIT